VKLERFGLLKSLKDYKVTVDQVAIVVVKPRGEEKLGKERGDGLLRPSGSG
jgi:hypothetical protein